MTKKSKTLIWIIVAVIAVGLIGFLLSDMLGGAQEVTLSKFIELVENGTITKIYADGYSWTGYQEVNGAVQSGYTTVHDMDHMVCDLLIL